MSGRTVITTRARPGRTSTSRMPKACEARSRPNSARADRSATCCASCPPALLMSVCPRRNSSSGEPGRALLAEGSHALGVVGGASELGLIVALDIELRRERVPPALVDRLLGARQSPRRSARKLRRQPLDHATEL